GRRAVQQIEHVALQAHHGRVRNLQLGLGHVGQGGLRRLQCRELQDLLAKLLMRLAGLDDHLGRRRVVSQEQLIQHVLERGPTVGRSHTLNSFFILASMLRLWLLTMRGVTPSAAAMSLIFISWRHSITKTEYSLRVSSTCSRACTW